MDWNETQRINLSAILRKPEGAELRVMPESPQITLFFLVMELWLFGYEGSVD